MDWHPKCISSPSDSPGLRTSSIATTITLRRRVTTADTSRRLLAGYGSSSVGTWREKELKRVDRELFKGNHKTALKIVKRMQGKAGGLRGFGAAKQVPYGKSSLEHIELDGVDMSYIEPMVESMLDLITKSIQSAFEEELPTGLKSITSVQDTLSSKLLHRVSKQHEAGHFIVAYLLGVLPRTYEVPKINATEETPNKGVVKMVDFASPLQGNSHEKSSKNLNKFSCIALGGLAAAYLEYEHTGGFVSDVDKLYITLNWMELTHTEAEDYLRWAILNTSQMLLRHRIATLKLADAMALGRSIGYCITTIEDSLSKQVIYHIQMVSTDGWFSFSTDDSFRIILQHEFEASEIPG